MKTRYLLLVSIVAILTACGGGGGSSSTPSNKGTVSVVLTDNLTLNYSEVWVNVQSISASDGAAQSVTLYQDATGQTHNLSQLANIGALVDAQAVAQGTYVSFDIVLANAITLVDLNKNVINATFDQTGSPTFTIAVAGTLTVDPNQVATLLLDFDLAQFSYDQAANTVTPVVVQKDPATLAQTVTTTNGVVRSINGANQFVLDPNGNGSNLAVTLHANATVTNATTGQVLADTSGLSVNMPVSVTGSYDAATLTITASSVSATPAGNGAVGIAHKLEGIIESVNGAVVTIDVKEANFQPGANSLTIDLGNAAFSHGSLLLLAVGQELELKGSWDGNSFTAAVAEIEGCARNAAGGAFYDDDYAEIEGSITAVNGALLTLTVQEREHVSGINVGDQVTIDSSNSWFEHGDSSCLIVGAVIEAKGPMSAEANATMLANRIEIENGCGGSGDDDDGYDDDDDD